MKYLFLDTNIYLMFYHFSKDDLEELRKLQVIISSKEIVLITTPQLKDEVRRNREAKIADAIKQFESAPLNKNFPQIFKQEEDLFEKLREACLTYDNSKKEMLNKVLTHLENNSFEADKLIENLFSSSLEIEESELTFKMAQERFARGKPPGKDKSLGDAIIWETLLGGISYLTQDDEFFLISNDTDFSSQLLDNSLNPYLQQEWEEKFGREISFYKLLSEFFNNQYPDISLALDLEKKIAINNLTASGSFRNTHLALEQLSAYIDKLEDYDIKTILHAGLNNDQIYSIGEDPDVKEFFIPLFQQNWESLSDEEKTIANRYYLPEDLVS